MQDFETLKYEVLSDASVGILKIDRPQALNALNHLVLSELESFLKNSSSWGVRCLILTGGGEKAFVAGADIKEMKDFGGAQAEELALRGQKIFQLIEDSPIPVIAAVNGFALGGGMELALSCDFILASENAKFGLPEVSLGIMPGYGGTQRLTRAIGRSKARAFALTGDMFSARQCYEWGLVLKVCESAQLLEEAKKMATSIASRAPIALQLTKKSINEGQDLSQAEGLLLESRLFAKAFETEDKNEGVNAFIEKRKPSFKGR